MNVQAWATVATLTEYLDCVFQINKAWGPFSGSAGDIWFRGISDQSFGLIPGAVWRRNYDEYSAVTLFENHVSGTLTREPMDSWEWYFLMQHSGLPTRLLDWSENPLIGLYFAVASVASKNGAGPCVWIMDPRKLNLATTGEEEMISPGLAFSANWLPSVVGRAGRPHKFAYDGKRYDNSRPLAILPRRREPRIIAQRGTFTVHGTGKRPIEDLLLRLKPLHRKITPHFHRPSCSPIDSGRTVAARDSGIDSIS